MRLARLAAVVALALALAVPAPPAALAAPAPAKTPNPRAWPTAYEPAALTAQELLANAKHADGSPETATLKTIRLTTVVQDGGLSGGRSEIWNGDDYRVDSKIGPFVTAWGRTGGQQWETNENGYTLLKRGIHKRAEANERALEKPDPGEDVKVLGRLHAPADVFVLRVAPPDGREERRFYDASTFRLMRREFTVLDSLVVVSYADYRTVKGVTIAFKRTLSDGHPENDQVDTITDVQIGVPIADAELAIPGSRRYPVKLPAGVPSVRLPARIDEDGHIIVRLIVNGRGLDFQLDSGADGIVLNRDVARQLGITTYGHWSQTVAGTFAATRAIVPNISIGPVTMSDVVVDVLPFWSQNDFSTKIVGLLGYDFIAGCVVKIDYFHGTVDAIPSESFQPPANGAVLDAVLDDNVPMVRMRLNNAIGERFILDTGADDVVAFSGFAKRHADALDDHSPAQIVSRMFNVVFASGVGGNLKMHATLLARLQLGEVLYKDHLAFVLTDDQPAFEGEDADGLAGASVLRAFDVYLDYGNSRVVLVPNKFTRKASPAEEKSAHAPRR